MKIIEFEQLKAAADRISVAVIIESTSVDSDGHKDRLTIYQIWSNDACSTLVEQRSHPLCEDEIKIVDSIKYVNDLIRTGDWEVVSFG